MTTKGTPLRSDQIVVVVVVVAVVVYSSQCA